MPEPSCIDSEAHPLRQEILTTLEDCELNSRELRQALLSEPPVLVLNYHCAVLSDAERIDRVGGLWRLR